MAGSMVERWIDEMGDPIAGLAAGWMAWRMPDLMDGCWIDEVVSSMAEWWINEMVGLMVGLIHGWMTGKVVGWLVV